MKNKTGLIINFENATIEMTRAFAERASVFGSDCYQTLQRARVDYPAFTVVTRAIKRAEAKETYRGLTFSKMEDYILAHDADGKKYSEYMKMREIADLHTTQYPHIKKWFLNTFPEVKNFWLNTPDMNAEPFTENGAKHENTTIDNVVQIESKDSQKKAS